MTKLPDHLRFKGGVSELVPGGVMVQWDGPWPPPERMGVAVGRSTGMVTVFAPEDVDAVQMVEVHQVAHVTIYKRVTASILPDDFEHPNVFRGADYEKEESDDDDEDA